MNKDEYLHQLEMSLKKYLSRKELNDILRDYGEYFEDGRRQNKSDTEISAKLGSPEIIAQQFIDEVKEENKNKKEEELKNLKQKAVKHINSVREKISLKKPLNVQEKSSKGGFFEGIFSLFASIINFCVKAFLFCLLLFCAGFILFLSLFVFFGVGFMTILCVLSGIVGIIFSVISVNLISIFLSLSGIFGSVLIISLGVLFGILFIYLVKKYLDLFKFILKCILKRLSYKEERIYE